MAYRYCARRRRHPDDSSSQVSRPEPAPARHFIGVWTATEFVLGLIAIALGVTGLVICATGNLLVGFALILLAGFGFGVLSVRLVRRHR